MGRADRLAGLDHPARTDRIFFTGRSAFLRKSASSFFSVP
jgi:hypothetical protein